MFICRRFGADFVQSGIVFTEAAQQHNCAGNVHQAGQIGRGCEDVEAEGGNAEESEAGVGDGGEQQLEGWEGEGRSWSSTWW